MRQATSLVILSLLACGAIVNASTFEKFCARYGCHYANPAEYRQRRTYFEANMREAALMQKRNPLATFGMTALSDRSPKEIAQRTGHAANRLAKSKIREAVQRRATVFDAVAARSALASKQGLVAAQLPNEVDWRNQSVVTPIKNQGDCGSCWAFAAIANIESMSAIAGYPLISLSEQALVSCDSFFAFGCGGSASIAADLYLHFYRNGSVPTDASYPYVSGDGTNPTCNTTALESTSGATVTGAMLLTPLDVEGMELFVATQGPLTVAVDATGWSSYQGGIFTGGEASWTDHQVVIVGYGTDSGINYWIVRNSWGTGWGESGYMRLQRGLCNVELVPTTATVTPLNPPK